MALKSLINGKASDTLPINDRGLQYGDGLFETVAVQNKQLLCWDEHIERLLKGCARLMIPMPDASQLKHEANKLITTRDKYVLKVIITRGQGGRGYAIPSSTEATRIISLHPWPSYSAENNTVGVKTRLCDYQYARNTVLAGVKHLNRLEQILARSEWDDEDIAEGIVLDTDSNVIEGTMSNIFYSYNNVLFTPDLSQCGIEGVIRNKIISLARMLNIDVATKETSLNDLMHAEEVFICNSIIGLWSVTMIDDKSFVGGNITNMIRNELLNQNMIVS